MSIVGQRPEPGRIAIGAGCVYSVAAFAPALDGGRVPDDPAASVVPFCAAFAIGFVPWGRFADRRGAAAAMRASCVLLIFAGALLCVPAGETGWIVARALEGLAASGFPPAAQAALAALGGSRGAGRAIGAMSVAVAIGTLVVPLLAGVGEAVIGTTAVLVACAVLLPAAALTAVAPLPHTAGSRDAGPLELTPGLVAAWACAFLVLIAYWTVVTRAAQLLGPAGAGMTETAARAVPLIGGLAGMALTGVVAGVGDRRGARRPMLAVLAIGAGGLVLGATVQSAAAAAIGVAVFSLAYWCYLTLVGLQVVRSTPAAVHGRALAGLYSAMWIGAAAGGGLAATGAGWAAVLAGGAVAWALAAGVAARWFEDSGKIGRRWLRQPATSS